MEIEVHPLEPDRLQDWLAFFDRQAFADNPEWAGCYCLFYHIPDPDWEARSGAQNREEAAERIRSGALRGLLAYQNGRPIGWCHADGKERLARLIAESAQWGAVLPAERVLSVVCFVIAPDQRRRGVARRLLQAACLRGAVQGYDWAEAYPRKEARTAAQAYHGPLALYRGEGFTMHRELEQFWIVRRGLRPLKP